MIRACAFDLGNTLSNDSALYDQALAELADWLLERGAVDDRERFIRVFERVNRETEIPYVSHTFGELSMFRAAFAELGMQNADPAEALERYRLLVRRHTALDAEIRRALSWLREQDVRLALLSNERTARVQAWFQATGTRALFDVVFVSESEGVEKPDLRYFTAALERIGVAPQELLMFGDNPIADGACKRAGIPFVHVTAFSTNRWYFERGDTEEPDAVLAAITITGLRSCIAQLDPGGRR